MKTICVIPALNEEKNIVSVVSGVRPFVEAVIVVDDGSQDETAAAAEKAGAQVIKHAINRGQGAALQTGNELALKLGADIIVHFDADRQFVPGEIPEIISPLQKNQADIVFGSRFMGKKANLPLMKRHLIMPLAKLINRLVFSVKLSDPQNGFRALSRRAAETITIENRGMAHNNEIQAKAFKYRLRVQEIPVTVIYHRFGQKLSGGLKIIADLLIHKLIK